MHGSRRQYQSLIPERVQSLLNNLKNLQYFQSPRATSTLEELSTLRLSKIRSKIIQMDRWKFECSFLWKEQIVENIRVTIQANLNNNNNNNESFNEWIVDFQFGLKNLPWWRWSNRGNRRVSADPASRMCPCRDQSDLGICEHATEISATEWQTNFVVSFEIFPMVWGAELFSKSFQRDQRQVCFSLNNRDYAEGLRRGRGSNSLKGLFLNVRRCSIKFWKKVLSLREIVLIELEERGYRILRST